MASKLFARLTRQGARTSFPWAVPGLIISGWLFIPCIDQGWRVENGISQDPEWQWKLVEDAKKSRLEAYQKAKGIDQKLNSSQKGKEEEEEEEEAEEEETEDVVDEPDAGGDDKEDAGGDDSEEAGGDDNEEAGDEVEDNEDEEEEEDEEGTGRIVKPSDIYPLIKKDVASKEEKWDNFNLKAWDMSEDGFDVDEEDDDCKLSFTVF